MSSGLSVAEYGIVTGKPLLALHGLGATGRQWARMAMEGVPGRRWICPDLRGHGTSPGAPPWAPARYAVDVAEVLDALGIDGLDVIGSSFGARVAMELCRIAPERVLSLVLLDPPLLDTQAWHAFVGRHHIAEIYGAGRRFDDADELLGERGSGLAPRAKAYAAYEVMASLRPLDDGGYTTRVSRPMISPLVNSLGNLSADVGSFAGRVLLLVAGAFDAVADGGVRDLRVQLGDRLTVETVDAGHALMWEAFAQVAMLVADFLSAQVGSFISVDSSS